MVHNKGNFEKVIGYNFFKLSLNIHTSIWFVYLQFYANHLFVVYAMRIINQQCRITFHLFIFHPKHLITPQLPLDRHLNSKR